MALHYAIRNNLLPEIRSLVESGADVNARDRDSRTPLMVCCIDEDENYEAGVARMLLQAGAKVGKADKAGRNSLMFGTIFGRAKLIELFLKAADFDISKKDSFGNTALHYASMKGDSKTFSNILNAFLRANANVNTRNKIGQTAASIALQLNRTDCVDVIRNKSTFLCFVARTPHVRPWNEEIKYVQNPNLMLQEAAKELADGVNIHKSRSDFNIHQFRRSRRMQDDSLSTNNKQQSKRKARTTPHVSCRSPVLTSRREMPIQRGNRPSTAFSRRPDIVSWRNVVPDLMDVLRVQVSSSYRKAAVSVPQTYDEIFTPTDLSEPNSPAEIDDCPEKQASAGQDQRRRSANSLLKAKVKPEFYDAFAMQAADGKRKGRRSSQPSTVEGPPVLQRRKTVSKLA